MIATLPIICYYLLPLLVTSRFRIGKSSHGQITVLNGENELPNFQCFLFGWFGSSAQRYGFCCVVTCRWLFPWGIVIRRKKMWGFPWPWGYPKWMVVVRENTIVRNGWLGVPLWLRKPPYLLEAFTINIHGQAEWHGSHFEVHFLWFLGWFWRVELRGRRGRARPPAPNMFRESLGSCHGSSERQLLSQECNGYFSFQWFLKLSTEIATVSRGWVIMQWQLGNLGLKISAPSSCSMVGLWPLWLPYIIVYIKIDISYH